MEFLTGLFDLFLHLDKHLAEIITDYGVWTYAILFLVIYMETGFVVTPFLPGDSLLFAAGSFAAIGSFNPIFLYVLLCCASIAGDSTNYWIGHFIGPKVLAKENSRILKKKYLDRTHKFYEKYGGKTVIIARFVPIVRTFAPFLAGVGAMNYPRFIVFCVIGALLWVGGFVWAGYFFGNLPFVKDNFSIVIVAIILISVLPGVVEYFRHRKRSL
ncbi:MAG: DedA family protein [Candidatus Zixiibacteriota bacterium]